MIDPTSAQPVPTPLIQTAQDVAYYRDLVGELAAIFAEKLDEWGEPTIALRNFELMRAGYSQGDAGVLAVIGAELHEARQRQEGADR